MVDDADVVALLHRLGGVARRADIVRLTSRAAFDRELRRGGIVRDAHGRYAVPVADTAVRAAAALTGTVSHRSAALWWGWEQKHTRHTPEVTVPRHRNVAASRRTDVDVHWADLAADDVDGHVTTPRRTLLDCLRSLPFDEALAIADSALRQRSISPAGLVALASTATGTGAARSRRVAALADGRAANPFESVLRAIALDVPGLDLQPQVEIVAPDFSLRPDLVDRSRRVVAEADSFAWHGSRSSLRTDTQRYNNLVIRDWMVLRFAWEDVMHDAAYVRRMLSGAADLAGERARRPHRRPRALPA